MSLQGVEALHEEVLEYLEALAVNASHHLPHIRQTVMLDVAK